MRRPPFQQLPESFPFYLSPVHAGFPSPAQDYIEKHLDLNEYLIKHPAATFFVKVTGESMRNAGIFPGDILVVDRALEPVHNKIVVAIVNGEFTVKRLKKAKDKIQLVAEHPDFAPIEISEETEFEIWGVVAHVLHSV